MRQSPDRRQILLLLLVGLVLPVVGSAPHVAITVAAATPATPQSDSVANMLPDISFWTLEEQVGQLLIWGSTNRPEDLSGILQGDLTGGPIPIGGVLLTSKPDRKRADVLALATFLRTSPSTPVPPLLCADQEGGKIMALREGVRATPTALQFGQLTADQQLSAATAMAEDTHDAGIDVMLAPVLDIDTEPLNPAIGKHERSFGDRELVNQTGSLFLQATWLTGIVPVVKHFPGHGFADTDSHKTLPIVEQSYDVWMQEEGGVFRALLDMTRREPEVRPCGVMIAHLKWPALTGNDQPTGFSKSLLQTTLRKKIGLGDQVIWSDDLLMKALPDPVTSAIAMRKAGIDLILVSREPQTLRDVHKTLVKYYRNGWLDRADLEASVQRILILKRYIRQHWTELDAEVEPVEPTPYF